MADILKRFRGTYGMLRIRAALMSEVTADAIERLAETQQWAKISEKYGRICKSSWQLWKGPPQSRRPRSPRSWERWQMSSSSSGRLSACTRRSG
jgi:hypothetical protein